MATFHDLEPGDTFSSMPRMLGESELTELVRLGGYTHPLFNDPAFAAKTPLKRIPLPGQVLLLVMGGLAEQTGRFDETVVALTALDEVRFLIPAFPGDALSLEVKVVSKDVRSEGTRGLMTMTWKCLRDLGSALCEAKATMLFRLD